MRRTVATFTIPRPLVKLVLIQKHHPSPRYTLDPGLTQVGAHSSHKSNQSATFRFDSGIKWHYPDLSRPAVVCMCSIGVLLQCLPVWSVGLGEKICSPWSQAELGCQPNKQLSAVRSPWWLQQLLQETGMCPPSLEMEGQGTMHKIS